MVTSPDNTWLKYSTLDLLQLYINTISLEEMLQSNKSNFNLNVSRFLERFHSSICILFVFFLRKFVCFKNFISLNNLSFFHQHCSFIYNFYKGTFHRKSSIKFGNCRSHQLQNEWYIVPSGVWMFFYLLSVFAVGGGCHECANSPSLPLPPTGKLFWGHVWLSDYTFLKA